MDKRANGKGCLYIRGNYFWAKWMYHGELYARSTKVRTDEVDEKGRSCARGHALAVMESYLEPFKHREEADVLSLMERRIKDHRKLESDTDSHNIILKLSDIGIAFENSSRRNDITKQHLASYKAVADEFAKWAGMSKMARSISPLITTRWADKIWSDNLAPHTFNGKISMMRQIWDVLRPQIGNETNPWDGIKKKKNDAVSRRTITDAELESILTVAGDAYGGDVRMLVLIGANTGLRIGDCSTLRWSEIDFAKNLITKKTEKTGAIVRIPLITQFKTELLTHRKLLTAAYKKANTIGWDRYWDTVPANNSKHRLTLKIDEHFSEFVCPRMAERHQRERTLLQALIKKLFTKAGIKTSTDTGRGVRSRPVATFHSLRHTFITKMAEHGVSINIAKEIAGHRSTEISEHYTHISDDFIKTEMKKME